MACVGVSVGNSTGTEMPTAFDGSTSPSVQRAVAMVKDAFKEVFASRGVAIRAGIGAVSTGTHVLPVADRTPAEVIITPRVGETVAQVVAPAAPAKPATVDPVPAEPYWRDNAPVTWPEGFKNGKPITAEAAILVGESSLVAVPAPTVKAVTKATKAKPPATKATKAVKVKKPKAKSDTEVRYGYVDLDHFRATYRDRKDGDQEPFGLVLERRGLFKWKLVKIELPGLN